MQVSVEQTSELSRKMTVSIPEEVIATQINARLKSLAREVKIAGFRPGKVPQSVIKQRYAEKARNEVIAGLVQSSYFESLEQQKLNPAGEPHIELVNDKEGLVFTADFEVYPQISLAGIEQAEAKRPVAHVEDADFAEMVEKLRNQHKVWNSVERTSENNDRVTVHFSGVCEGENFTDGKVSDYPVEIGSNKMIPGFEDQLIGLQIGENKSFEVSFPTDYGNQKLAGKVATFEIEVAKIEAGVLPDLDAEFIKHYGIDNGDIAAFNDEIRNNMERELEHALHAQFKTAVLDAVYEQLKPTVPNALVDQEIATMMKPYAENAKKYKLTLEDLNLPRDMFEEQAKRRVALGLILGEIIESNQLKIDEDRVRSTIEDLAKSYENPDEVVQWHYADKKRLNDIRQMVLEDQTVDWIMTQIKIVEENLSFTDVMDKQRQ